MRPLSKLHLLAKVEESFRASGGRFQRLTRPGQHPAEYIVYAPHAVRVRVYVWNITHGGGRLRPADEYRIQVTGPRSLVLDPEHATLILGWWAESGVFAGWDARRHAGPVSQSPSMQVREQALQEASIVGMSVCHRGRGEVTVAFRPEMMLTYVANTGGLQGAYANRNWAEGFNAMARGAVEGEGELPPEPAARGPRRRATARVSRALRSYSFRRRVLAAYEYNCAACGLQLELVEAAHIVPVHHERSTDETANGLCLCALHHKAYDTALVLIGRDYRIRVNEPYARWLSELRRAEGLDYLRERLRDVIAVPAEARLRPMPDYLEVGADVRLSGLPSEVGSR